MISSDGHWAQAHSLLEGCQLLNPLNVLSLWMLMRVGDLSLLQSLGPTLACKPSAGHSPTPTASGCSADSLVFLYIPSPEVNWVWLGEGVI